MSKKKKKKNNNKSNKDIINKTNTTNSEDILDKKPSTSPVSSINEADKDMVLHEDLNNNTKNKNPKKHKKILIVGSLVILFLGSSIFVVHKTANMSNKSYDGIYIDDIEVGNLDRETLKSKLTEILSSKLTKSSITLNYDNTSLIVDIADIGAYYDIDSLCDEIISYNKSGNLIKDTLLRISLKLNNLHFKDVPSINESVLDNYINSLSKELNIDAKNPEINFKDDAITATKESIGRALDTEKLKNDIIKVVTNNIEGASLDLKFNDISPTLTKDVAEKMVVLGSHKTKLPSTTGDRTSNIKLFMSKLNKSILAPNEEFSCDERAGSRERSDGYKAAPGYINGKVVPIVAGGICQGSTTIYNALLYADLEILERHPHSMPVTYAENGRDAAIAKGSKDLKFKNNTNNPIIINTYVSSDGYVVAKIWGIPEEDNKEIKLSVKHINSKAAKAYKHTYIDGKLVKTELLSQDRYK